MDNLINETTGGKVTAAVITIGMAPVNAAVQSWTLQKLWTWFLSGEYGPGPSRGAWYGIGAMIGVMMAMRLSYLAHKEGWDKPSAFLYRSLELPLVCLFSLAATWSMGSIIGWVA